MSEIEKILLRYHRDEIALEEAGGMILDLKMFPDMAPDAIRPKDGSQHYGCATCGNILTLPGDPGEEGPWCTHAGQYRWIGPRSSETTTWTQMVPIKALPAEA